MQRPEKDFRRRCKSLQRKETIVTTAGKRILKSAKQALAFAEGKEDHGCTVHIPEEINVRRIRKKLDMSQKAFAEYFGVNLRTVQDWE